MDTFNSLLKTHMSEGEVLSMIAFSNEFESMMVREVSHLAVTWNAEHLHDGERGEALIC